MIPCRDHPADLRPPVPSGRRARPRGGLSWIFIRVPFGYVLEFFYGFLNNYGLALILFSFVVKLILLPFSAKSKKSMMKMSRLQPQLKQLELACGDDKQKYQQEVMALYKSEGVSMYGGCLWSFLPLLFLLPLYTVIREPLHYLMHLNTETVDALKAIVATEQGVEVSKLGYYWQYGPAADLQKYALQLTEKQKVKFVYGMQEKQFRGYYEKASRAEGNTGEVLLSMLERRLDNVVYRLGYASTRREARQLVNHGHFTVNGKRVNIPSYLVKVGDLVSVCEASVSKPALRK